MKLSLNPDFAKRHLGVAALFLALSAWFAWDGAVKYPNLSDTELAQVLHREQLREGDRTTAIGRQFQFAGLLFIASMVVGFGVLRAKRKTLEWDDKSMTGSLTGFKTVNFDDITDLDTRKWKSKGIFVAVTKNGDRIVLDAWHHLGVKDLATKLGV